MTTAPQPPYQHCLTKISADPNKPDIFWLHFSGSDTPYAVPVNTYSIERTHAFLEAWMEQHEETEGPWTWWNFVEGPKPAWVKEIRADDHVENEDG